MKAKMYRQQGFSMVEAMVSALVLSGGLLGLAFLQVQGMKFNAEAYQRTQATVLAYEIIDRLRANPVAAHTNGYSVPNATAATSALTSYESCAANTCYCDKPDGSVACSTANLAVFDLGKWYQAQTQTLALDLNNLATITRTAVAGNPSLDRHTIRMRWLEQEVLKTQEWEVRLYVPPGI
jgi:type IV pilus assembly protein PilV